MTLPVKKAVSLHKNRKGFTLLEVLISLAILSISMLGIYSLVKMALDTSLYAQEKRFVIERGYDRLSKKLVYPSKVYEDTEEYDNITVKYTFEKKATPIPSIEEVRMTVATDKAEVEFLYYTQSGGL